MKTILTFLFFIISLFYLSAQTFDGNFMPRITRVVNNGQVVELEDGNLIVGGGFSFVNGVRVNKIARLDNQGNLVPDFDARAGFNGAIKQMELTNEGKIIIAGGFSSYNGRPTRGIIRLFQNGQIDDSFNIGTGFDKGVDRFIQLENDELVAIGPFENYNGQAVKYIAKILPDGRLDANFNENGSGLIRPPHSIEKQGEDKILLGLDSFTSYNEVQGPIVRINADGIVDNTFQFLPNFDVWSLTKMVGRSDGSIALMIGASIKRFMLLSENGLILDELKEVFDFPGPLTNITEEDDMGNIYVNVLLSSNFSEPEYAVYQYSGVGTKSRTVLNGGAEPVFNVVKVLKNNVLLVDGVFELLSQDNRSILAKAGIGKITIDTFMTRLEDYGWGEFLALQNDGKIIVGGVYQGVNNEAQLNISRINPDGSLDRRFRPVLPRNKTFDRGIAIQDDGKVLIASNFDNEDGLYRLNEDGSLDETFHFATSTVINRGEVVSKILILPDERIGLIGQRITLRNSATGFNGIIWLNSDGSVDETFSRSFSSEFICNAMVSPNNRILIAGENVSFNGHNPASLIRINENNELDLSFARIVLNKDQIPGLICSMDIEEDGSILLGGSFNMLNDEPVSSSIVCFNPDGTLKEDSGIEEGLFSSEENPGLVTALKVLKNGYTLVAGSFTSYNNIPVDRVILLDKEKQLVKSLPFYRLETISAIVENEDGVYLGGRFLRDTFNSGASLARLELQTVATRELYRNEDDLFEVYPTLIQDVINIVINSNRNERTFEANLFDLNGRIIKRWENLENNRSVSLPENLVKGVYFIQLKIGNLHQTKRLIRL